MPGVMENVGVLNSQKKLTDGAMQAIVERLNEAQINGTDLTPPVPKQHQLPADILDKEKYPAFHKEVIGAYEGAVTSLNLQGNFSLPPPFIDPLALAKILNPGLEINFDYAKLSTLNPVTLALIIEVTPLNLISKLALPPNDPDAIIKPPIPNFSLPEFMPSPAYLKELENISRPFPTPGFPVPYLDKIEFDLWKSPQLGMPSAFAEILKQLLENPSKILGLVSPKPDLKFAIEAMQKSGIFGKYDQGEITKAAIQQDLIKYTAQAAGVLALGMAIGDGGPTGATGLCAGGVKLTVTKTKLQAVVFDNLNPTNRKMVQIVRAFLGDPSGLSKLGAVTTGNRSLGDPGIAEPNFIIQKGYKGSIPVATKNGTVATSCGYLPPTCIDVLLGGFWDAGGGEVDYSGKPAPSGSSSRTVPSPIREALAAGVANTPKLATKQVAGGKGTSIPKGPLGCMVYGKLLRAWVPSGGGRSPDPGDVYFVTNEAGNLLHVGLIVGGDRLLSKIEGGTTVITADAGQGPAGSPRGGKLKVGDAFQSVKFSGGVGTGLPLTYVTRQETVTTGNIDSDDVQLSTANVVLQQGVESAQQSCWARKLWHPGTIDPGTATMTGDFGEGPDQVTGGTNYIIKDPNEKKIYVASKYAKIKLISGWISIARLIEVIGSSVPNGNINPYIQNKYKTWVEFAYQNIWDGNEVRMSKVARASIVFDDDDLKPKYYNITDKNKIKQTY